MCIGVCYIRKIALQVKSKVSLFHKLFKNNRLSFGVLYLHYIIFMDNSVHHMEKNNYASADTYLHSAISKWIPDEFQT